MYFPTDQPPDGFQVGEVTRMVSMLAVFCCRIVLMPQPEMRMLLRP